MANPIVRTDIPNYANLKAALWVSDVVDVSGTPTKGAWDALNSVAYPAYGAGSMTGIDVGTSGRRALRSSNAACGIDLSAAVDPTTGPFHITGMQLSIVALVRKRSTGSGDSGGVIINNRQRFSPNNGYQLLLDGPNGASGRATHDTGTGASFTTTAVPVDEWAVLTYAINSAGTPVLWENSVMVSGTGTAVTGSMTYGSTGLGRQIAMFSRGSTQGVNAQEMDIAAVLVFDTGEWTSGNLNALGAASTGGVLDNPGAFLASVFDFGDGPDETAPDMTGTVVVTPSTTSASAVCPTATDNVGVVAYEASLNGTTWPFTSSTPTVVLTSLTQGTSYTAYFRAKDAAGLTSTPISATFTTTVPPATATTLSGPNGGQVGAASSVFTVGANGAITGTITVTPSDSGGGGAFTPTSVTISSGTPTATFVYTPASSGVKAISISDNGSLTDAAAVNYTASSTPGRMLFNGTNDEFRNNTRTLLASKAVTLHFHHATTGALVAQVDTTTDSAGLIGIVTNATLGLSTNYRVDYKFNTGEYGVVYRSTEAT